MLVIEVYLGGFPCFNDSQANLRLPLSLPLTRSSDVGSACRSLYCPVPSYLFAVCWDVCWLKYTYKKNLTTKGRGLLRAFSEVCPFSMALYAPITYTPTLSPKLKQQPLCFTPIYFYFMCARSLPTCMPCTVYVHCPHDQKSGVNAAVRHPVWARRGSSALNYGAISPVSCR